MSFKEDIIPEINTISTTASSGTDLLDNILLFVKDSLFGVLGLVAVGMFLYAGFNIVKAQGNPEELKKAWMTLLYVIIGMFVVAISWALIRVVSGLNF